MEKQYFYSFEKGKKKAPHKQVALLLGMVTFQQGFTYLARHFKKSDRPLKL